MEAHLPPSARFGKLSMTRCFSMKTYCVYILASRKNGTLYMGVTGDLIKRVYEHKQKFVKGFTADYNVHQLVYYEQTESVESAILREKQLKNWHRQWKINLINQHNPMWDDLYSSICGMDAETSSA